MTLKRERVFIGLGVVFFGLLSQVHGFITMTAPISLGFWLASIAGLVVLAHKSKHLLSFLWGLIGIPFLLICMSTLIPTSPFSRLLP